MRRLLATGSDPHRAIERARRGCTGSCSAASHCVGLAPARRAPLACHVRLVGVAALGGDRRQRRRGPARTNSRFERSKRSTRRHLLGAEPVLGRELVGEVAAAPADLGGQRRTSMRPSVATSRRHASVVSGRAADGTSARPPRPAAARGRARRSAPATSSRRRADRRARGRWAPCRVERTASAATSPAGNPNSARRPAGVSVQLHAVLVAVVADHRRAVWNPLSSASRSPDVPARRGPSRARSGASNWTMNVRCRDGRPMCSPGANPGGGSRCSPRT